MARPLWYRVITATLLVVLGFGLVLGAIVSTGCARSGVLGPPQPSPEFAPLSSFISQEVAKQSLVGAGMVLIVGDEVVYEETFGLYRPTTVVPIASSSKWLSSATIMALVDEGVLGLDDPVSMYLPMFSEPPQDRITVRQSLAFTTGLGGDHACLDNRLISLDTCVQRIADSMQWSDPGEAFWYGGASYQIAGLVAEAVTGQRWEEIFQQRIADPLNMSSTNFFRDSNPRLAGGAVSSLRDYANFVKMQLNDGFFEGRRILSFDAVREIQKDQLKGATITFRPPIVGGAGYGLGVWREVVDSSGNAIEVSDPGAFGFFPWIDHDRDMAGVFLVFNSIYDDIDAIRQIQQLSRDIIDARSTAR